MDDFTALRLALAQHPADFTPRGMLADWLEERGKVAFALAVRRGVSAKLKGSGDGGYGGGYGYGYGGYGGGYGNGGGDGGGDGGYGGDGGDGGYGGYGYGGGGYGGGGGDGGYGGYGGDGGYGGGYGGDGDGYGGDGDLIPEGFSVTDGLYLIVTPGGYYPYVRVGWVEWSDYDIMVPIRTCRVVRRFGSNAQLANLAAQGPQPDTMILDPAEVEYVAVTEIVRAIPADSAAWKQYFSGKAKVGRAGR